MKRKGTKSTAPTLHFRHFWMYALILFSLALILILLAGYFQNLSLKSLENQNSDLVGTINQNTSVLNNIQELNKRLQTQNEELKDLNKELSEENNLYMQKFYESAKDNANLKIINDSYSLYLQHRYAQARKKLSLIDESTLTENTLAAYNAAKELII